MKTLIVALILLLPIISHCQTYNTKVEQPKKVTIENKTGGKVEIINPKIVIINELRSGKEYPKANVIVDPTILDQNIYVVDYKQQIDSAGLYVTTIEFGNVGQKMATDVSILVRFDKKFEDSHWDTLSSVVFSMAEGYLNDKTGAFFKAGMMTAGRKCILTVKSKEKIYATITGANGVI